MTDETRSRVIDEAALAKRFETEINERASTADIPALIKRVEKHEASAPQEQIIDFDVDGVPYIKIGD